MECLVNLIEAVKIHPQLFTNSGRNDDHDDLREWTEVAEKCKLSVSEAQDQWNLLLIEYVEYLRNNQDFYLAQYMDFLQPYFFTIKDDDTIDEHELLYAIEYKTNEETTKTKSEQTKNEEDEIVLDCTSFDLEKNNEPERIVNSEINPNTFNNRTQSISLESNTTDIMPKNSSFTNLSSLELIFLGYAKQLQKMPLQLQLKTKRKIADIMDEAELQMLN